VIRARDLWPLPFGLGVALLPLKTSAQISPGPLSRPHERVEGSTRCLECHELGRGVSPVKCFACHKPLQERVAAGKGLHARAEYRDCKTCHVEHQGREFDIVWWGKAGRQAFDHRLTGHPLEGKHARLTCAQCHKTRSFLGPPTSCSACHADEHRGQFKGRECDSCHTEVAWKPAPGFDHGRTSWPLTGRHVAVTCAKCHRVTKRDPAQAGATYRVFGIATGRECLSCHEDVHEGRLGQACATCHTTASWRASRRMDFDHDKTAYPLRGLHEAVACDTCHLRGKPVKMRHEQCTDCHADAHAGQLARRADGGRCESCHDVSGFRPARFGLDEHAKTTYPLVGAHLAVSCDACHPPIAAAALGSAASGRVVRAPARTARLRFASHRCAECHPDAHRGDVARFVKKDGCEGCHRVESWRHVTFDHALTRYPLAGGHARATCTGCHHQAQAGAAAPGLRFPGVTQACEGCHGDPHQGQFARAGKAASCDGCHATETLKASKFDHARDSVYHLDGAHARLACAECHRTEARGGVSVVRYKPLPTTCKGCHGSGRVAVNGNLR